MNATFNAGIDYFNLESGTTNALKVVSSNENRSKQSASGPNTYGDATKVDSWGETAAPSSDYEVVGTLAHTTAAPKITLGSLIAATNSNIEVGGTALPVVVGGLRISTSNGGVPTVSVSGQAVHASAAALRTYKLPPFTISPRHRGQDFFGLCTIKKGSGTLTVADDKIDYGLESCNGNLPIEFTLGQPKGELKSYDLHGGMATVDFVMHWYATGKPTIELVSSLTIGLSGNTTTTVVPTMSNPVAKECPKDGYTQYTWQVSFPMIGFEAS